MQAGISTGTPPAATTRAFPDAESKRRVIEGGTDPRWNPNGGELFYRDGGKMMVVGVRAGDTLAVQRPRLLFETDPSGGDTLGSAYDVSAGGERFVMIDEVALQRERRS